MSEISRFTVACWVLLAITVILSVAATGQRARARTDADWAEVLRTRRYAIWTAGAALVCSLISVLTPSPADGTRPEPQPSPSCAYLADFPDSDPPIFDVCVPPGEAG